MIGLHWWNWSTLNVKIKKQLRLTAYFHLYFTLSQVLNLSIGKPHIRKHLNQLFIFLHLQFEKLSANTSTAQLYLYLILIQSVIHISFITHINLLSAVSEPNSLKKIISLSWRHHHFKYRSWNNEPKHHKVYLAAVLEPLIILRYLLLQAAGVI